VDSYLDGSPSGDPVESTVFTFYVADTDGDGMPDSYELLYTNPPSGTALNAGDDLEPDGLTNLQEYQTGTDPTNPDTDGDTLQDSRMARNWPAPVRVLRRTLLMPTQTATDWMTVPKPIPEPTSAPPIPEPIRLPPTATATD